MKKLFTIVALFAAFATLPAATNPSATVKSTAFEAAKVILDHTGWLCSLHVYNNNAAEQYILIIDAKAVPANGPVNLLYPPIRLPGLTTVVLPFNDFPLKAAIGIVVCNSTTGTFTKTAGAADCMFVAQVQ